MKIIAESGVATAAEKELAIPDPSNALEILKNATTKPSTKGNDSKGNQQNRS